MCAGFLRAGRGFPHFWHLRTRFGLLAPHLMPPDWR
jgi:hypothetical protein